MSLVVEAKADRYLRNQQPDRAVLITIYCNYGMPVEALTVELNPQQMMRRDPTVTLIGAVHGLPVYANLRVAAFARWHSLCLTTQGPRWWPALAIAGGQSVLQDIARWERTHPGMAAMRPSPAA
jgi:hypothetical protein